MLLPFPGTHSQVLALNPETAPAAATHPGAEGLRGLCGPFQAPIPAPIPLPRKVPLRKQRSFQQAPWVTCFSEAVVLSFRARLHRYAQVPVGARHCGLGRRKGRETMKHCDRHADSRRPAEGGGDR